MERLVLYVLQAPTRALAVMVLVHRVHLVPHAIALRSHAMLVFT